MITVSAPPPHTAPGRDSRPGPPAVRERLVSASGQCRDRQPPHTYARQAWHGRPSRKASTRMEQYEPERLSPAQLAAMRRSL